MDSKVPGELKSQQTLTAWPFFSSTVCLREVILALLPLKWAYACAYERCPFTGGKKARVLGEKLPGQQLGVRLREVKKLEF